MRIRKEISELPLFSIFIYFYFYIKLCGLSLLPTRSRTAVPGKQVTEDAVPVREAFAPKLNPFALKGIGSMIGAVVNEIVSL